MCVSQSRNGLGEARLSGVETGPMTDRCGRGEMETRTDPFSLLGLRRPRREEPVRVATPLRSLLGVSRLIVMNVRLADGRLIVDVRPSWKRPRCSCCGRQAPGYDRAAEHRAWQALTFGTVFVRAPLRHPPRALPPLRSPCRAASVGRRRAALHPSLRGDGGLPRPGHGHDEHRQADGDQLVDGFQHRRQARERAARRQPPRWRAPHRIDEFSYRKRHR